MGKNVRRKHACSPIQNHPGFIWGLFNILKHNHWRYIKKRLPHRRHVRKHGVGTRNEGNNKKSSNDGVWQSDNYMDSDQRPKKLNSSDKHKKPKSVEKPYKNNSEEKSKEHKSEDESKKHHAEEKSKKPNSENKKSVKALIKAIISEDKSKRNSRHHRSSTYPMQSNSGESKPLPHMEALDENSSNDGCTRVFKQKGNVSPAVGSLNPLFLMSEESSNSDSDGNGIENDDVNAERKKSSGNEKASGKEIRDKKPWFEPKLITDDDDTSPRRAKAFIDALNLIHMNRDFFLKVLQDPGSPLARHFQSQQALSAKMVLTKAGSFSYPSSSSKGDSHSNILKNSKDHNASFAKRIGDEKDSSVGLDSMRDIDGHLTGPSIAAEYRADGIQQLNQAMAGVADEDSFDSGYHTRGQGKNQVVVKRFKDLRQKIKHTIKESKDERHRITMDALIDKVPRKHGFSKDLSQDVFHQFKEHSLDRSRKEGSKLKQTRRTSSLCGSLDRYLELYECSFHKEVKTHKGVKSQSEADEIALPSRQAPKTLGRIRSLPDMKSYSYETEDSPDSFYPERQLGQYVASGISDEQEQESLDVPKVSGYNLQSDISTELEIPENIVDTAAERSSSATENKLEAAPASTSKAQARMETYKESTGDQDTEPIRSSDESSEDSPPPESRFSFDEKAFGCLVSQAEESELQHDLGTITDASTSKQLERKAINDMYLEAEEKAKFDYVKDILEVSGFSSHESLATWHSDYQPLDPSVFEEVTSTGCMLYDSECSGNEEDGDCNHMLLFDLINEVLIEIYERCYYYIPVPLSSLCHIHPMSVGYSVLRDVWFRISCHLRSKPKDGQSLDDIMSRDLSRVDGWMNLQFDSECVGLEVEDWIFDDLLDELLMFD